MLKAFWTWDPVSSGNYRSFDEPFAYQNNEWFFDKSVWQRMFRTMAGCGFNAIILANTHPFPFMIDLSAYPESEVIDPATFAEYQAMHRWIFNAALDFELAPFLLFFTGYYPAAMLKARGIEAEPQSLPPDLASEYIHYCTRALLETYHELVGILVDAAASDGDPVRFVRQAVVDAVDAARPDAKLYIRSRHTDPQAFVDGVSRRGGRPVSYLIKYTRDHLVDPSPDAAFTRWIDVAGAGAVMPEFRVSNFEPWTSFSYETVEGIIDNLGNLDCPGFSCVPLAPYEWPRTSDEFFKFQFQRDLVWYGAWGGTGVSRMIGQGSPKWLVRNSKLLPGFQAGSRILELLSLYMAGGEQTEWRAQFCAMMKEGSSPQLLSIEDMLDMEHSSKSAGCNWWREVTGDCSVHLSEYIESGTPANAYGPDELIEELADLTAQAIECAEKGMRSSSGERELPALARDAFCMGRLGEFYVERLRAALCHGRANDVEALEHMARALGLYREIKSVDMSHRRRFRAGVGRCGRLLSWLDTIRALEAEYHDVRSGDFRFGAAYPFHVTNDNS